MSDAERLAQEFHETYELLAPNHGYRTRQESAVPWADVPRNNKKLMIATAQVPIDHGWQKFLLDESNTPGLFDGPGEEF